MKNVFVCIKKSRIIAVFFVLVLLLSHFVLYCKTDTYKNVVDSLGNKIFNSFSSEYDSSEKDSNIFFFLFSANYRLLGTKPPKLHLPLSDEYEAKDGKIYFKISSSLCVKSAGEGIVKSVGYLENGLKFVEIKHSGNVVTRYENLKIVGVGTNFLVKDIHIIGIGEEEVDIIFCILKNGQVVNDYQIENGEIKWQN